MVFFVCTAMSCGFALRVHSVEEGEAEQLIGPASDWFPDKYPCPRCAERMVIATRLSETTTVADLTPQEAFIAFSGAGLPAEGECSASRVHHLLTTKAVKDVTVRHIRGTNRCTLDCIELEDGTKLYVGASAHGASVYRVQELHHYAEETNG